MPTALGWAKAPLGVLVSPCRPPRGWLVVRPVSVQATRSAEVQETGSVHAESLVYFSAGKWFNMTPLRGFRLTALREFVLKVGLLISSKWAICMKC